MNPYEKELRAAVDVQLDAIDHGLRSLIGFIRDRYYTLDSSPSVDEFRHAFLQRAIHIADELSKLDAVYDILETVDAELAEEQELKHGGKNLRKL